MDRYEVSRRDWLHYFPEGSAVPRGGIRWSVSEARTSGAVLDWPAFMSQPQAKELARRRGMRLLTGREWIHVAVGRRAHTYPWGAGRRTSVANTLELHLGTPSATGVFEGGRSHPYGCYDMLGNVWEWVSDRVPGYDDALRIGASTGPEDELVSILGGAYNSVEHTTFGGPPSDLRFHARTLDRDTLSPEIGVRLGAEVGPYLREHAAEWVRGPGARERVQAVGRSWAEVSGREYVLPVLEELAREPGAAKGLRWLAEGARSAR